MKVLTLAGTRPELIRLSIIIEKLDKLVDHVFVFTNQNYHYNLSTIFFDDLKIRKPNYTFENNGHSFAKFFSNAMEDFEQVLKTTKPDKILILGDTNTGLLSLVARKMDIPVYHMEAGNRCYDSRVPEETNRKVIDSLSTYNLPYTENSKQNLLNEGYDKNHVFKIGNPIYEVLNKFEDEIDFNHILGELDINYKEFVLVTAHRSENVDDVVSLTNIVTAINEIANRFKVVFSVHPRTKEKLLTFNLKFSDNVIFRRPFSFFEFVKLERSAKVVISDSGTVQEECCIYKVPSITIRNTTERQETIECGSNILSGINKDSILTAFNAMINRNNTWTAPEDYLVKNVSDIVINILLGK
jgi:UDP-N-acetylglucosamine 2-epimerase (non-hydrolysing)